MFFKKKQELSLLQEKKIVALIDYENISMAASDDKKFVDFYELHRFLTRYGQLMFAFIFLPEHYLLTIGEDLNNLGYTIVIPQKMKAGDKIEDTADINIIQTGMKFLEFSEITGIVVVSNDHHMIHLIKEAKNKKKEVFVFGTDKLSNVLRQLPDINFGNIPLKDK